MGDLGELLIILCGLGFGCIGSLLVLALLLFRFTGLGAMLPAMSMFNALSPDGKEDDDDDDPRYKRKRGKISQRRLQSRGQVEDPDFDAAIARHRDGTGKRKPGRRGSGSMLSRSQSAFDETPDTDRHRGLRSNPSRPRRDTRRSSRDSSDDEAFGGMMDDDGDGYADF